MSAAEEAWPDERIDALQHSFIGPTWQTDEDGSWKLPDLTLGWGVIEWAITYLHDLNATGEDGRRRPRWSFTDEQARFVLWWYAVGEDGKFLYRNGVLQRMKGWGKDPLLAVLSLVELCGPVVFDGWDASTGEPLGKRNAAALVLIAAVSQDQTTNTTDLFNRLISDELKADCQLEIGAENIWAFGRKVRLQAVTSNFRALEGKRSTFVVLNEPHHWLSGNRGHAMYETLEGNATKMATGRYLSITNAFLPGEDSVAERQRLDYVDQVERGVDNGLLYDSIEADPETPLLPHVLRKVIPIVRGDAVWLDPENIIKSILKKSIGAARSRRMWLNMIVSSDDAMIPIRVWDRDLFDHEAEPLQLQDAVTLGFDGGKTDDATAFVAIRLRDGFVQALGIWERDPDDPDWIVPKSEVHAAVHRAFKDYNVRAFYADVAQWEADILEWSETYREDLAINASGDSAIAWDMRNSKSSTMAHERLLSSIENSKIRHRGDLDDTESKLGLLLRKHVLNTRRRENRHGVGFGKESRESPNKVDAYAAMMLAHEAMTDYRNRHREKKQKQGWGRIYSAANYA